MDEERFFSGYCRKIDSSRSVCAEVSNGALEAADCDYPTCPYCTNCPIAAELDKL